MSVLIGLIILSISWTQTSYSKPVALPVAELKGGELSATLPSEQTLLGILVMNLLYILGNTLKYVFEWKNKKDDQTEKKVDLALTQINEIKTMLKVLETRFEYSKRPRDEN